MAPKDRPSLTIALLYGGTSSEREVSIRTGTAVAASLKRLGHVVHLFDAKPGFEADLAKLKVDLAFLALHGSPGEDGTVQGLLDFMGIPYTGCGLLASAIAIDKVVTKRLFLQAGLATPAFIALDPADYAARDVHHIAEVALEALGLPCVIKPTREGSSVGLRIVRERQELVPALKGAFDDLRPFFVERFVAGSEVTVGILGNPGNPLPVIRIVPRSGVFDYKSKYTKSETEYEVPAALPREVTLETQRLAREAFATLGCRDYARVDLMIDAAGQPYVLEVNTIPGMTETSLLPKAASAIGMGYDELCEIIVQLARARAGA